jgi:hypothetical protein
MINRISLATRRVQMKVVGYYLDALTAQFFKTDAQGREYFFPLGIWSRGRLLPDPATAQALRRKVRRLYGAVVLAAIGVVVLVQAVAPEALVWAVAVAGASGLGLSAYLLHLARPFPKSDVRLTYGEAMRYQVAQHPPVVYAIFAVFSALLSLAAAYIVIMDARETFPWSILTMLGSGAASGFFWYLRGKAQALSTASGR